MRWVFSFIILTICCHTYSQNIVEVSFKNCKNTSNYNSYVPNMKLFKDSILLREIKPKHGKATRIKGLKFGKYTIEYKSIFQKKERFAFEVNSKKVEIALCLDYMDYDKERKEAPTFFESLTPEDKYEIKFQSGGCFHNEKDSISITKTKNSYIVELDEVNITLDPEKNILIQQFELELRHMMSGGCTTIDTYFIKLNNEPIFFVSDGTCKWNGFYYLKRKLKE